MLLVEADEGLVSRRRIGWHRRRAVLEGQEVALGIADSMFAIQTRQGNAKCLGVVIGLGLSLDAMGYEPEHEF